MVAVAAPPTFAPERVRAHVAFLADDLLEGRDTGSRGHEIAARYVANQFASYGLKPGGENGTWFQTGHVSARQTAARTPGSITISGPAGEKTLYPRG